MGRAAPRGAGHIDLSDVLSAQAWSQLRAGLVLGLLATAAAVAIAFWRRRIRPDRELPGLAGLAVAGAATLALWWEGQAAGGLALGLVLLAGGGLIATATNAGWLARAAVALPGAAVLAMHAAVPHDAWVRPLVLFGIVAGGTLVADFDRRWQHFGYGPIMAAGTALGVYVTVPETQHAIVLLGAALPAVLLAWPRPLARLGSAGSLTLIGIVLWVSAVDGAARPTAIVGGAACLGLLLLEPTVHAIKGRRPVDVTEPAPAWRAATPVVALHAALVLIASRGAGLQTTMAACLALVAVEVAVGVAGRRLANRALMRA